MTIRQVIEQLTLEGLLTVDQAEVETTLAKGLSGVEESTPWYIRLLIGLTAWLGALFFLIFLLAELLDGDTGAIITGLMFCGAAIVLRWQASTSVFLGQLALVISLAGQGVFMLGVGNLTDSIVAIALATIVLELLLIGFYRDILHRFLSTLVIIGALLALLWEVKLLEGVHGLMTLLAVGSLWLWMSEAWWITNKLDQFSRPIAFGFVFGLFGLLLLSLVDDPEIKYWWLSALGLWLVLLGLEYLILRSYEIAPTSRIGASLFGGTLLLLVPSSQTPGILGALIVLLLGFQRGNRVLMGLATIFLIFFLANFYYLLELTLLMKSLLLMLTGLLIFTLRYVLLPLLSISKEEALQ